MTVTGGLGGRGGEGAKDARARERALERVTQAAKLANAHDFISKLPDGYDTDIGSFGGQVSGGQKQRIAIARALINKPRVLLLDEATSALDSESEAVVQATLDELITNSNLTTVMIAHRLTTVRHMDVILVVDKGAIAEMGTHDELMAKGDQGLYYQLVQAASGGV